MSAPRRWIPVLLLLVLGAGAAALWWWSQRPVAPDTLPGQPQAAAPAPALIASGTVTAAASAPADSAIAIAPAAASTALAPPPSAQPPLAAADWPAALAGLFGREPVLRLLQGDDFARRVVATVDNLGRDIAPSRLWPLNPSPGRFEVGQQGGQMVIAAGNSARYDAPMALLQATPTPALVALYGRTYPLLQQAYAELGYPKGSFHQRLLEVLDLLLATPQPATPLALVQTQVKGSVPSTRPWVRYELADPRLEQLAAGQKILLRVGPAHGQRLRARLAELRAALQAALPAAPTAAR